jgi:hypothetical protein
VKQRIPALVLAEIEATTACRASCVFCPRGELRRPAGSLSRTTAESLAARLADFPPRAVLVSGFGEPTLHPDLPGVVDAFTAHLSCPVGVVTNGENLTPDLSDALMRAGVGFFHVSVPAATIETAARVAPGLDFARAEANLRDLLDRARNRLPVAVNFVITAGNRAEKKAVCRTWQARGAVAVYAAREHNRGGFLRPPATGQDRRDCWIYRATLFVAWNGQVLSCCHDLTGEPVWGDLAGETVEAVLQRKKRGRPAALATGRCRGCDFSLADF